MVANPAQLDIPTADSPGRVPQNTHSVSDLRDQYEQAKEQNPYQDLLALLQSPSKKPIVPPVQKYTTSTASGMGFGFNQPKKQMRPANNNASLLDIISALYGTRFR